MRSVTCVNHANGKSIEINEHSFAPVFLASLDGIYASDYEVAVSNNTMTDGGVYQGSREKVRNIVITAIDQPNNVYNRDTRDILRDVFRKNETGTLIYHEDGAEDRQIDYYVESIRPEGSGHRLITISLICPEPHFTDTADTTVYMANIVGLFEWPHEFKEEGEEISIFLTSRLVNIVNDKAVSEVGFTAKIETTANITNPSLTRVEGNEHIQIGSAEKPFKLRVGETLTITTGINNKHLKLTKDGVTTEVNEYLTEDSEFFNLITGDNHIVYNADTNVDTMQVFIEYRNLYDGA